LLKKHYIKKGVIMQISKAHNIMASALNFRSTRQDMIAGNIANIDTPFYRPKDIEFQDMLAKKAAKVFNTDKDQKLEMARTSSLHMETSDEINSRKSTVFFRDGHLSRNDGNSVDLDIETTELSKNSVMYNALTATLKKESAMFKSALAASEKL